jgi:RHS repeat-associated protein
VYVSNESDQMVYFDNLQVSNIHARIIEENHYYAYGLKIAALSSRKLPDPAEGAIKNNNLYNEKELWDDGDLNWYDYGFRNYDPQIGRFPQLDPLTHDYPELTPFQYAGCEPIANVDLDGLEPLGCLGQATNAAAGFGNITGGIGTGLSTASKITQVVNVGSKIASQKIGNELINQALQGGTKRFLLQLGKQALTKGSLIIGLLLIPQDAGPPGNWEDMFNRPERIDYKQLNENLRRIVDWMPKYSPAPELNPTPTKPPNNPPKDDNRKYWQYKLTATEDGDFEVMERGLQSSGKTVHLKKGEIWKYGTTLNPESRYTKQWLQEGKLELKKEYWGTKRVIRSLERAKIMHYQQIHGRKPPGNKQFSHIKNKLKKKYEYEYQV